MLLAQLPAAGAATVLYAVGGFELVGWVSVGVCLAAAALAARLPEPAAGPHDDRDDELGYLATLRAGVGRGGVAGRGVRGARAGGRPWSAASTRSRSTSRCSPRAAGVPTVAVPLAMLPIGLAGALGAALGGSAARLRPGALAALLGAGMVLLGAAGVVAHPVGLAAVVALFYGMLPGRAGGGGRPAAGADRRPGPGPP